MSRFRNVVGKVGPEELKQLQAKWSVDLGLGKNPTSQGSPVTFTAHLDDLTAGMKDVPLSTSALANGYRTPYVIDEIRMQAYTITPVDANDLAQPSYAVSFQFRTGSYAFSKTAVPMILHQPAFGDPSIGNSLNIQGPVLRTNFGGDVSAIGDEARWVLAKPLWMAPGDQIQAFVSRDVSAASGPNAPVAMSVDVTYIGRALKAGTPGPKTRFVPWIAHYIHDFDNAFSQTTTEFRNPFTFPMVVQKLVGRPLSKRTGGTFITNRISMLPTSNDGQYATIYMEDSYGYKITRSAINGNFTPVGAVFDTERCTWTFVRPLGAREQINMMFQTRGSAVLDADQLFGVAMHCYREEAA